MSLKDAMVKAFEKAGEKLPSSPKKKSRKKRPGRTRAHKRPVDIKSDWKKDPIPTRPLVRRQKVPPSGSETEQKPKSPDSSGPGAYEVEIDESAKPAFHLDGGYSHSRLLVNELNSGNALITDTNASLSEEELFLGLDFGTSSLKAVIGDRNRRVHYAVPFRDAVGIEQYLLPTRLYQCDRAFQLTGEVQPGFHSLKLDLMSEPGSNKARIHVVAFLALAIRQIGGWFRSAHGATYSQSSLLWSLNLGVPAAEAGAMSETMELVGWAAWIAASSGGPITEELVSGSIERAAKLINESAEPETWEDVEVGTVPEIAAQIYGYVKSDAFVPNAQNLFVLADVGAGTVDCAMFKIRPGNRGEEFLFYEKSVEPLGVTSLHVHRLHWWRKVFSSLQQSADSLLKAVENELEQIDANRPVPDKFSRYFTGVRVQTSPKGSLGVDNPDADFDRRLGAQIQEGTLGKGRNSGDWHVEALKDTPFLLSGGGSRNKYYERIKERVQHHHSLGYLRLTPTSLILPSNITAPGLPKQDWDRLSVAYGLSFPGVGNVTHVAPLEDGSPQ